jgi:hypothetical protein
MADSAGATVGWSPASPPPPPPPPLYFMFT